MMNDIDDLQHVYIEYMNLNVLDQDLLEVMRRIILAKNKTNKKRRVYILFIDLVQFYIV